MIDALSRDGILQPAKTTGLQHKFTPPPDQTFKTGLFMRRLSSFLLPLKSLVGLSFVLVACSHLPSGAPDSQEILKEIQADDPGFAFYQVTRDFVPTVANWPETGSYQKLGWMTASEGPKSQVIQPGDLLHVQVWDSNENSLMTVPGQRFTRLEGLKVSGNGSIFMPYVGNISLSGLSPELAREKIQDALEPVVSSAQVQLTMREGRNNSVDLAPIRCQIATTR
jgi:polysaccharide export outer membrane protein